MISSSVIIQTIYYSRSFVVIQANDNISDTWS